MKIETLVNNYIEDLTKTICFIGAGFSIKSGYKDWHSSIGEILDEFNKLNDKLEYSTLLNKLWKDGQYLLCIENIKGLLDGPSYEKIIKKVFKKDLIPNENHKLIVSLPFAGFVTTNFDQLIESAYAEYHKKLPAIYFNDKKSVRDIFGEREPFLFKVHGDINRVEDIIFSKSDYDSMSKREDIQSLFRKLITSYQLLFIGYSFNDPDLNTIWNLIIRDSKMPYTAVMMTQKGTFSEKELNTLKNKNIKVLSPENVDASFSFLTSALKELSTHSSISAKTITKDDDKIISTSMMLIEIFDEDNNDTFIKLLKSIIINEIIISKLKEITTETIYDIVSKTVHSEIPKEHILELLKVLETEEIIRKEGRFYKISSSKINRIINSSEEFKVNLKKLLNVSLDTAAKYLGCNLSNSDIILYENFITEIFKNHGKNLAEKILFQKNLEAIEIEVSELLKKYLETNQQTEKYKLFEKAIYDLFMNKRTNSEEILYKLLQMFFITSSYILNPNSERLLKEYLEEFIVYIDSNIVLQAMASGHPNFEISHKLINKTYSLGIKQKIIREIFIEICKNMEIALSKYEELKQTGLNIIDALGAYVNLLGSRKSNVFILGYYNILSKKKITWNKYLHEYLNNKDGNLSVSQDKIRKYLELKLSITFEDNKFSAEEKSQIKEITNRVIELRKAGYRYTNDKLCEAEATQFFIIYKNRIDSLANKVWFISDDHFITKLFEEYKDKYDLPSSYTPLRWYQYLQMVDYDARANRHFNRFFNFSEISAIENDLAIETINMFVKRDKNLMDKGVLSASEFAENLVKNHHIKQIFKDYTEGQIKTRKELKAKLKSTIDHAYLEYVTIRRAEWEDHNTTRVKLTQKEKELKRQKFKTTEAKRDAHNLRQKYGKKKK